MRKRYRVEEEFKKAVWKEGFSLEQNVFRILEKDGWEILPNRNFFDSSTGLTREFDLLAYKSETHQNVTFFIVLIIECKFNPHRIVFYIRSNKKHICLPQLYAGDFVKKFYSEFEIENFFLQIKKNKKFFTENEQIFGHQTFEKKEKIEDQKKIIHFNPRPEFSDKNVFSAINTVIQATIYEKKIRNQERNTATLLMYFPIVIFSGQLYKASLGERKMLKLEEIFRYRSGRAFSGDKSPDEFDIYICSISSLNKLLKVLNYIQKQFSQSFFKRINRNDD